MELNSRCAFSNQSPNYRESALVSKVQIKPNASRIASVDAIRGIAVLGIFIVNVMGYGIGDVIFYNPILSAGDGPLNTGLWTFQAIFVEGSMRGLFTLLFGASIVLFTSRAAFPDGRIEIADLYYRRTLWLILFGLIHSYLLLGAGDILLIYGIASLLLFPFRILRPKTLFVLAGVLLVLIISLNLDEELSEKAISDQATVIEQRASQGELIDEADQLILDEWNKRLKNNWPSQEELEKGISQRTGSVDVLYSSNAEYVQDNNDFFGIFWWVLDGAMMMFMGMALFKTGVLTGKASRSFYLRLTVIGYAIGLGFRIWSINARWEAEFSPILWAWASFDQFARVALTIGHIGLFYLIWSHFSQSWLMRALAATGRMALSNYIGQTIIANLIFSGIGLGLYASFDLSAVFLILIGIWIAQLLFSLWWLSRFRYGPLEWVWRGLTYGKLPSQSRSG